MRRTHWIVLGVVVLMAAGGGVWWWLTRPSPASGVREALEAGQDGNLLRFERYVDVERFSEEVVPPLVSIRSDVIADVLAQTVDLSGSEQEISLEQLRSNLPGRLAEVIKQAVRERDVHAALITEGEEDYILAVLLRASGLIPLKFEFEDLTVTDSTHVGGISETAREGNRAIVEVRVYNHPMDTTLALELRLEQQDDDWRVVQPENLRSLLEDARERQYQLVARTDSMMKDSLAEAIEILGTPRRRIVSLCRYCSENAEFTVRVANRSPKPATYLGIRARWPSVFEEEEATLSTMDTIPPGETVTIVDTTYGSDDMLRLAPVSDLEFLPEQIRLGEDRDDPAWFRVDDWDWYLNYWARRQAGAYGWSEQAAGTSE